MPLPGNPQWHGRQGTAFKRTIRVTAGTPPQPVPLTGYGVRMQIRRWYDTAGEPLLSLTRDEGLVVDDLAGEIVLTITATQMAALPATLGDELGYPADLELVPDGDEDQAFALLAGPFPVDPEVTRDDVE